MKSLESRTCSRQMRTTSSNPLPSSMRRAASKATNPLPMPMFRVSTTSMRMPMGGGTRLKRLHVPESPELMATATTRV